MSDCVLPFLANFRRFENHSLYWCLARRVLTAYAHRWRLLFRVHRNTKYIHWVFDLIFWPLIISSIIGRATNGEWSSWRLSYFIAYSQAVGVQNQNFSFVSICLPYFHFSLKDYRRLLPSQPGGASTGL